MKLWSALTWIARLDPFALHVPSHRIWLADSGLAEKGILCAIMTNYSWTLSLRRTSAPPRKLFWVLGCWVVVCVKADYFPGAGGVGSLRLRPLFVPSIAVPSRPPRLFWIKSIYQPLAKSCPFSPLSLSTPADNEAHALHHGGGSSTSPSMPLRPKVCKTGGLEMNWRDSTGSEQSTRWGEGLT